MKDANQNDNQEFISDHRLSSRWRRARDGMRPAGSAKKPKVTTKFSLAVVSIALAVLVGSAVVSEDASLRPLANTDAGSPASHLQESAQAGQVDAVSGSLLAASARNAGYATQLAAAATLKIGEGMALLLEETIAESMKFTLGNLLYVGDVIVADVPAYQPPQLLP